MKRFRLSAGAAQDSEEIWDYIVRENIEAADRVAESLLDAARRLGANPGLGHKRVDLAGRHSRETGCSRFAEPPEALT